MATQFGGPKFNIESDRLVIGLGHTERSRTGALLAQTFDQTGLFPRDIVVRTINQLDGKRSGRKVKSLLADSVFLTHSAALEYVDEALQVIAFNPPEPTRAGVLIKRALVDLPKERIEKEAGAHQTGLGDMVLAGAQMVISPVTTYRTMSGIWRGYSAANFLAGASERFPAGKALVESELDAFLFPKSADLASAAQAGVSTAFIEGHYHNELLFAPSRTLAALAPHILPETVLVTE